MALQFNASSALLSVKGSCTAAQINTLFTTPVVMVPAPTGGNLIRPHRIQLVLSAQPTGGTSPTAVTLNSGGHIAIQLNSTTPNILASGADTAATPVVTSLTAPSLHTAAWSTGAAAATGINPLPDGFWTVGGGFSVNQSRTTDFSVLSLSNSAFGGTTSGGTAPTGAASPLVLLCTVANPSGTANLTVFWQVTYEIVPVNPY